MQYACSTYTSRRGLESQFIHIIERNKMKNPFSNSSTFVRGILASAQITLEENTTYHILLNYLHKLRLRFRLHTKEKKLRERNNEQKYIKLN